MTTNEHHAERVQAAKDDRSLQSYAALKSDLLDKSDEELRALASEAGVDGVDTMSREHLIERLTEEPGVTEA